MKTLTRRLLATMLVATPMLALVDLASANTELVPASRLVAPYWDVSGSRTTLFMLTNVSKSVDLLTIPASPFTQPARGIHIEFYDKTCVRQDTPTDLSAGDVDQLDLKLRGMPLLPSGYGWADIDVRAGDAEREDNSIQCNVLLGVVVNADSANDFAIAYPMASAIGSSYRSLAPDKAIGRPCTAGLLGDPIATHDVNGAALAWTGFYEPFPARVFVPFFFAEGGPAGMKSQLVVAAPADGNWQDGALCAGAPTPCSVGESPGQNLPGLNADLKTGFLMDGTGLFWDGCENKESRSFGGHYINAALSDISLLGAKVNQAWPWTNVGVDCKGQINFPTTDGDFSGAFIGWVDLPNTLNDSTSRPRGLVGILIQNTSIGAKEGDVVRLWGDPSYGDRNGAYSLVDDVLHNDLN